MTNYLVTGGAGFIGSNIVRELYMRREKVKILDNFSTGKHINIQDFMSEIECIDGDITDPITVKKAVSGIDVIIHQAAIPSVQKSLLDPLSTNHANITGTLTLLYAAKEEGVKRMVYAASSSAYGANEILPKAEDMVAMPMSPYAISKYTGEAYCKVFYDIYGLETISLRYFNVFGPHQDLDSKYAAAIPSFIRSILADSSPEIYGDGTQSRDFTYVSNVVSANLLAATAPKLSGEVINIGTGERTDLNTLTEKINTIIGKNIKPIYLANRLGDVKHSLAKIDKAEALIGYKPIVSFDEGLRKTIEWIKTNN